MKKVLAMILCAALLLAALPAVAVAAEETLTKEETVIKEAQRVYQYSLSTAEKESFAGFCGLMTSHQLWHMGINSWLETYDGNKQFDAYAAKEQTSGGYYITPYPADTYTLEQALNSISQNGTKDVYNILVGFEWTSTEAGATFGHACVINAILDGTVYLVESFYTSLGGEEGNVISCSIEELAAYFADWTTFDGVIHFSKDYADSCQSFGTDVFVRTRFDSTLRSQPCLVGENGSICLRSIGSGELLRAVCTVKNSRDELYYRIQDGDRIGYVAANAVSVTRLNSEDVTLSDPEIPTAIQVGKKLTCSGTVTAQNSNIDTVKLTIADAAGNVVLQTDTILNDRSCDLQRFNALLSARVFPQGAYTLTLQVQTAHVVANGRGLTTRYAPVELLKLPLLVGSVEAAGQTRAAAISVLDGWHWDGTTWYYYRQGQPCTGWLRELGVDYYLKEDGSVTTGWAEIDGVMRYFSATGAMCTGWLAAEEGICYLQPNGGIATGLQKVRGNNYCFDENGLLLTGGTVELDGISYTIGADGVATAVEK